MRGLPATVTFIVVLALAAPAAGGCGGGAGGAGTIRLQDLIEPAGFAVYYPDAVTARPSLPSQPVDARQAAAAGLPPAASALLQRNGFVLTPGGPGEMVDTYLRGEAPPFVTLDSLACALQSLCSWVLAGLEEERLRDDLEGLAAAMLDASLDLEGAAGEKGRAAARSCQEFFGVAARLLDPAAELPAGVAGAVDREVRLIEAGAGRGESPLFGREEDYGAYVPRGRYALSERGASYFRALTFLKRAGMRLRPPGGPRMRQVGREETRTAVLLVGGLHRARVGEESALEAWERLFQVNRFFGTGWDDFDVYDYTSLMGAVYGKEFSVRDLESDEKLDGFIERALELRRLDATSLGAGDPEERAVFTLLGRDATPDGYVFDQLTDPRVKERRLPRGLDLAAAMGSGRARQLNLTLYEDARYPEYEARLESLRRALLTLGTQVTAGSVYWNQLFAWRSALVEPGGGFPAFMANQAWADRSIYSSLGAWTALRCAAVVPAEEEEAPVPAPGTAAAGLPGYVEPNPEALARMAGIVDVARRGLKDRGLLAPEAAARLDAMHSLLSGLKGAAEKELQGQPFDAEEAALLAQFGEGLRYAGLLPSSLKGGGGHGTACVTRAYDDAAGMETLQEAVGYPVACHVIVPYLGGQYYAAGACYSYYEFRQPLDDPLGPDAWRAMLRAGSEPLPPAWAGSFLGD